MKKRSKTHTNPYSECVPCNARKKNPHEAVTSTGVFLNAEARASVSLDKGDGETQYCEACHKLSYPVGTGFGMTHHTCGLAPMTAAERRLVQVALGHPTPFSECVQLREAITAVRSERKERK